jgi:hypothetical protein
MSRLQRPRHYCTNLRSPFVDNQFLSLPDNRIESVTMATVRVANSEVEECLPELRSNKLCSRLCT